MLRRPNLRIPAPKINERLSVESSVLSDPGEQRREVLLRETLEPVRALPHGPIV
jgi:hypothetical protein